VSLLTEGAQVATAVGVLLLAAQVRLARSAQRASFEQSFNERYERIADRLPIEALLGEPVEPGDDNALRVYYDYFALCEEEVHYRSRRKVSRSTWADWSKGIVFNMGRPAFQTAWDELRKRTGHFTLLAANLYQSATSTTLADPAARHLSSGRARH